MTQEDEARARRERRNRHLRQRHSLVGPGSLWMMKRSFQIAFLKDVGLEPQHALLDLGCGTLRGGLPIVEYLQPARYFGVDVRPVALAEARKELAQAQMLDKRPTLVHSMDDLPKVAIDFAWSFSVLFHMTELIMDEALRGVAVRLAPGGQFYANVAIGDRAPDSWLEFPVIWRTFVDYERAAALAGLTVSDLGALRDLGHVSGKQGHDSQRMLRFLPEG